MGGHRDQRRVLARFLKDYILGFSLLGVAYHAGFGKRRGDSLKIRFAARDTFGDESVEITRAAARNLSGEGGDVDHAQKRCRSSTFARRDPRANRLPFTAIRQIGSVATN
jgi:hypothetical protein